jgi:hypothetical protein
MDSMDHRVKNAIFFPRTCGNKETLAHLIGPDYSSAANVTVPLDNRAKFAGTQRMDTTTKTKQNTPHAQGKGGKK